MVYSYNYIFVNINIFRSRSDYVWSPLPDKQESPHQRRPSPTASIPTQAPNSPRVKRSSSFSKALPPVCHYVTRIIH